MGILLFKVEPKHLRWVLGTCVILEVQLSHRTSLDLISCGLSLFTFLDWTIFPQNPADVVGNVLTASKVFLEKCLAPDEPFFLRVDPIASSQ